MRIPVIQLLFLGILFDGFAQEKLRPGAEGHPRLSAVFDKDGRTYTINAPGGILSQSGFSATIERHGKQQVLSSENGAHGANDGANIHFKSEGAALLCRLEKVEGRSGVRVQAGIRNTGAEAFNLVSITPVALDARMDGNPSEWLVTALDRRDDLAPPVVAMADIHQSLNIHECGGLYRRDGTGFLVGPVGKPIAYVDAQIAHFGSGRISFHFSADMSGVRVDPGETRWGQELLLLVEPPQAALAHWAESVAKSHKARTSEGALSGWSSAGYDEEKTSGADVLAVVDEVRKAPERLRPGVIQIERGYEDPTGNTESNARFPEGLAYYARRIADVGSRPGLCLQAKSFPDSRQAWSNLIQRARHAVESGFTYLKIDCTQLKIPIAVKPGQTSFETMRDDFMALRKAVGPETYLLYSGSRPNRAAVGAVDASRTGAPARRNSVRHVINDVLRSYALQGRWFAVDNDMYYMETFGVWPLARTWMSMVGLSCGAAITSDPWHLERYKPYRRSVEVMTPPAAERTEVPDLCTSRHWPRLTGHVTRDWGAWTVALLWNPGAAEQSVLLDFAEVGLDPEQRYAVWSFWENRFLGVVKGSWTTPPLAPSTSQHLCFTGLDRKSNQPVLIGSNLHIYCGAAEIGQVRHTRGRMSIELTDAGAREGDLFVYSRWPPVLKTAVGCTVNAVDGAGENVWRIGLQDRASGSRQHVELGILIPVTRQLWFWMLIVAVAASLLFAAWRYVVDLRLQREHVLERERTRIAGDIHDEVGANLTQISILGTLAARPTTGPETAREYNLEMIDVARDTVQALEEIVWSINPKSDSIKSVAHFICRRAEEILETGDVQCRVTLDVALPDRQMTPGRRHGLLLAFKEAIHNILKHAGAKLVQVCCEMDGSFFEVSVFDDGCGFDLSANAATSGRRQGSGLENMRRRLTELGGTCSIESCVGEGTQVCFRLPVD